LKAATILKVNSTFQHVLSLKEVKYLTLMIEDDVGDVGAMDEGDPQLPGSKTGTRNARKCCQDLLFIPHHGLHQPVLQHHGAVPGQANQLAVKILELGDVVGEVDELQG
jgi:hypothetical protein